jgi:thiamine transport system substrate-binding protein
VQKRIKGLAKLAATTITAALLATSLAGCSATTETAESKELTVVTHDSAVFSKELLAEFKTQTGITVKQIKAGDTGAMTNKLVLTKDEPIGDAFFGIDNTFAGVATDNKIVDGELTAVDFGDVCLNYDKNWFTLNEQAPPTSIADLTKPDFAGLTVLTNPATSSPGLAFLAATIAVFGDAGWQQYWRALKANDVKIAAGWEDAYFTDFSGSSGKGNYPIVLSYSSSPAFEVRDDGISQTQSVLDGCFRQTEYAGVLAGAKNKSGAQKFVEFLTSKSFQTSLPDAMYVYPIDASIELPAAWAEWAPAAIKPVGGQLNINANRKSWLTDWSNIFD